MTEPRIPTDEQGNPNLPVQTKHCAVTAEQAQPLQDLQDQMRDDYIALQDRANDEWNAYLAQHKVKLDAARAALLTELGLDPAIAQEDGPGVLQLKTEFLEDCGVAFLEYPVPDDGAIDGVAAQAGDTVN
jgi:hypothetical protein